jgi:hypothetical protein
MFFFSDGKNEVFRAGLELKRGILIRNLLIGKGFVVDLEGK